MLGEQRIVNRVAGITGCDHRQGGERLVMAGEAFAVSGVVARRVLHDHEAALGCFGQQLHPLVERVVGRLAGVEVDDVGRVEAADMSGEAPDSTAEVRARGPR